MRLLIAMIALTGLAAASAHASSFDEVVQQAKTAMMANPETALQLAAEAEVESQKLGDVNKAELALIEALWLQGEALTRLNRIDQATPRIEAALRRIEAAAPGTKMHGDILKARSSISSIDGEVIAALDDLHKAHEIYVNLGEARAQAIVLQNLGTIYERAGDYRRMLDYYESAAEVYPEDPVLAMSGHNNRGNALKAMKDYAAAEEAYRVSLAHAEELDSPILESRLLTNLASALFFQGKLDEAEDAADQGLLRGLKSEGAKEGWQPFLWGMKAQIAYARGDLREARSLIERAFENVDITQTTSLYKDFHYVAQQLYNELGMNERAFAHLAAYNRVVTAELEAAASVHSALLAAKFDATNQELRITKLETERLRKNRQLAQSEARIQLITIAGIIAAIALLVILGAVLYAFFAVRRSHRDVSNANDKLRIAAERDALTGLPNRQQFRYLLQSGIRGAVARGDTIALFLIDLDHFKDVNDTLGHASGDELLCRIADRMRGVVRNEDVVCRLGGDEFAIVLGPITDRSTLVDLADRVIEEIRKPVSLAEGRANVGATIGIALGPDHGEDVDSLSRAADLALYAAKDAGRGRSCFYEPALKSAADQRRVLETDLKVALPNGELSVVYQPIVDAKTSEIESYEALLRWKHPERGLISPDEFIAIAEESNLITVIGEWVLRTACREAVHWPESIKLAVNLSALQVESDGLVPQVLSALSSSGLPPERLELEVTESIFLRESERTTHNLEQLRALGVSFALDDFGTGYSSLGYLHRAEFSKIKIDRSFVRAAIDGWDQGVAVIEAIVTLANSLGMKSTAEGVETEAERALLERLGCSQLQGFLFGKGTVGRGEQGSVRSSLSSISHSEAHEVRTDEAGDAEASEAA